MTYPAFHFSAFLLLGAIIAGIGATYANYGVFLFGELVFGLGVVSLETAQAKIYTYWFFGNHLAFIYAFNLSVGRVVNSESFDFPWGSRMAYFGGFRPRGRGQVAPFPFRPSFGVT